MSKPLVGLIMGSNSDWETMQRAAEILNEFGIPFEKRVVSAHRTPDLLFDYAAQAAERGLKCIIAGAGGAAHLAGVIAAETTLPVIGVPIGGGALNGVDALYAMVQMPGGIPVATMAIFMGSRGSRPMGASMTPWFGSGCPHTSARYSLVTSRTDSAPTRAS